MSRACRAVAAGLTIAGLLVVASCAGKKVYGAGASTIETTVGRDFVIELEANPTTGYAWQVASRVDPALVALITSGYEPGAGDGGRQHWTFRAVGRGTTTIRLDYIRPWETASAAKSTTFTLVVR